jgi:hypothetical protein
MANPYEFTIGELLDLDDEIEALVASPYDNDDQIQPLVLSFSRGCDILGLDSRDVEAHAAARRARRAADRAVTHAFRNTGRIGHVGLIASWDRRAA